MVNAARNVRAAVAVYETMGVRRGNAIAATAQVAELGLTAEASTSRRASSLRTN